MTYIYVLFLYRYNYFYVNVATTLHHSPRTFGRRGGGVGILVNNTIKVTFRRIHVNPQITSFELMEAVLTICSISLRLIVIYRMPPSKINGLKLEHFMKNFLNMWRNSVVPVERL